MGKGNTRRSNDGREGSRNREKQLSKHNAELGLVQAALAALVSSDPLNSAPLELGYPLNSAP